VAAGLLRQQHQQQQQQQQLQQLQQVHQQQQQMVDGATAAARATSAARASACVRGSSIAAGSGDIFGIFVGALVGQHDGSGLQYDMQQRQQVVGGATAAARASATWADARASVCMRGGSGAAETGDVFAGALLGQHDGSGLHCVDGAVDADDEQRVGLLPGTVQEVRRVLTAATDGGDDDVPHGSVSGGSPRGSVHDGLACGHGAGRGPSLGARTSEEAVARQQLCLTRAAAQAAGERDYVGAAQAAGMRDGVGAVPDPPACGAAATRGDGGVQPAPAQLRL